MHPTSRAPRRRAPRRRSPLRAGLALVAVGALTATLAVRLDPPEPAAAQAVDAHDFSEPVFSADARGDIATIGNVTTTCDPTYANAQWSAAESAAACHGATAGETGLQRYDGAAIPPINNRLSMRYVDVDSDPSTFASSTARLDIPAGAVVLWAGLHWNAATEVPAAEQLYGSDDRTPPRAVDERFRVRFATPTSGGYLALDASPADGVHRDGWDDTNPGGTVSYGGYVDVTRQVAQGGSGTYGVADVQSCTGFGGCFASWSLTVAYAHPDLPPRNLNVWHGWQLTTPTVAGGAQTFAVNGIVPPPRGPVDARIGVVQADGDRGLGPDSLEISSPSHPTWTTFDTIDRPLASGEDDWFNSTVTVFGARRSARMASPNLLANLNQDIALVQDDAIIANDDRSFSFRVQTAGSESLYSQVVHSAVEIHAPEVAIAKGVDPAGPVAVGDEVTWRIEVRNVGIDPIRTTIATDPLPDGLELVPDTIEYVDGGPAAILGRKTEQTGDDEVDWDPAARQLTFRVGAAPDPASGGTMAVPDAIDGSDHLVIRYRTIVTAPPGSTVTNPAHVDGEGRELDDPFGPITTRADATATIDTAPSADLGITKTDHDAVVRDVGDRFVYELEATNAGPSAATGVTIADDLDEHLRFASSPDGCRAVGRQVSCAIGDLAVGDTATRHLEVEVVELPGPGRAIPNLAVVDGDQPNPDCDDQTPDALCNTDDEETPQPAVDLGITKRDGDAVVRNVGDRFLYTLEVTNAGPDDATAVVIDDELDAALAFAESDTCAADGQHVRCLIGDVPAGERRAARFDVTVRRLPPVGGSIPNVATVRADEPDPDCTDGTPDVLCNADDEHTPRAVPPAAPPKRADPPATLARTGATIAPVAGVGLVLLFGGGVLLLGRARRRREYDFWER